jgi:hypothetical protein
MRFFRPDVEIVLKTIALAALIALMALPVSWGYEQRRQAQTWRRTACAARISEVAHETSMLVRVDVGHDPCTVLDRLGLDLDPTLRRRNPVGVRPPLARLDAGQIGAVGILRATEVHRPARGRLLARAGADRLPRLDGDCVERSQLGRYAGRAHVVERPRMALQLILDAGGGDRNGKGHGEHDGQQRLHGAATISASVIEHAVGAHYSWAVGPALEFSRRVGG